MGDFKNDVGICEKRSIWRFEKILKLSNFDSLNHLHASCFLQTSHYHIFIEIYVLVPMAVLIQNCSSNWFSLWQQSVQLGLFDHDFEVLRVFFSSQRWPCWYRGPTGNVFCGVQFHFTNSNKSFCSPNGAVEREKIAKNVIRGSV